MTEHVRLATEVRSEQGARCRMAGSWWNPGLLVKTRIFAAALLKEMVPVSRCNFSNMRRRSQGGFLQRTQAMAGKEGGPTTFTTTSNKTRPVATNWVLTVLVPSYGR